MTPKDTRKSIELHVANVVMPLIIEEADEQQYRDAETALNVKIKDLNRTNPTMNTEEILAFLSLEYYLNEKHSVLDKKMKKLIGKINAFMSSLCEDE